MTNNKNKYNIKIPKNVLVIYNKEKKIITFSGILKKKTLKLELKIFINELTKTIWVSPLMFSLKSRTEKKKIKIIRNTTLAKIKHMLIESSTSVYKKLNIHGVGYRAFFTEFFDKRLLTLKLGYSHFLFIKTPKNVIINCNSKTELCIFGNSYKKVSNFSALVKSQRLPDNYKGKGIRFGGEILTLKAGKKV